MSQRPEGRVERPIDSLAHLHYSEETLDSILGHIGRLAVDALEGWDAAGTTIVQDDKIATYGITDDRVVRVDQSQYESGRGPCVDASKLGQTQYFDGHDIEPRWRQFAEAAADAGVYSVLSFPLEQDGRVIGALNVYATERDALRPGQREEGQLFASQAAVSLANAQEFQALGGQIGQLEEGLRTRTMIGQATGLLMAQEGMSSEDAFQKLVRMSQNANLKLRDVAQRYVETWETELKGPRRNA